MEETTKTKSKFTKLSTASIVSILFSLSIILICGIFFLFNYRYAYDNAHPDGGFFSPRLIFFVVYHFIFIILSIIAAIIFKIIFRKKVLISILLLAAVLLPILCYNFNYYAFDEGRLLYPLVDEGGIFHFIVIGDYNFDGMNDEMHHHYYEERTEKTGYGGHFNDTVIDMITTTAVGTGGGLSGCHCSYDWEKSILQFYVGKSNVTLKQIDIRIEFKDPSFAHHISFYLNNTKLNHTINIDNSVSLFFDTAECLKLQYHNGRYIPIKYVVNE